MKKKILIPTDFSKNAWNALTYAADLFKHEECSFIVLNTYRTKGYNLGDLMVPEPGTPSYESAKTSSEKHMDKLVSMIEFRDTNPKHEYEIITKFGGLMEVMEAIIEQRDIELVVMGTKGASNSRGALFGTSTILAMEKLRNCPVMGVPLDVRVASLKEIVMPTGYKTHYKRKELSNLTAIANLQEANICVLYVNPDENLSKQQEANKELLAECLEDASFSFHHLSGVDATIGVRNFVESRDSDMVAIINRKHAFFGSVFTTPMIKELGMFSKVPLLVMHDLRN
ncbi:universal stress protein [Dokdonia sp. Dokd-P16]|uniref:universal stress protein n=1 Tax=Dokdonia sp. Dokd-P16 TaxID=2173169 RepID=UPI000D548A7C|nr:universal stress protein [Dokdonia sp. Dokd-P16]AWH75577.1 universal stress protein [Dokdonia sp. Dokd-P16]